MLRFFSAPVLRFQRAAIVSFLPLLLLFGCGGNSSSSTPQPTTSGLSSRVLVSNVQAGVLELVNASNDTLTSFTITTGGAAGAMLVSSDKKKTLSFNPGFNVISVVDNVSEALVGNLIFPDNIESVALSPDGNTVYAALRNSGLVTVVDLTTNTTAANIAVRTVRRLVLSHNGSRLLAFSDDSDLVNVIDTATRTATKVSGFDRPVFGVFSMDDTKAYILSCGPECGGTAAAVTVLDLGSNTAGASVVVSAATTALLDGTNLYVAGTGAGGGKLDVVNVSSMTVSKSGVAISDGFHQLMSLGSNNKLFIGARTCNNVSNGCLSIFNTGTQTAVIGSPKGEVTGLQPITGRNVMYVVEGGELRIYDTSTDKEQSIHVDIVGRAVDAKAIN